MYALFPYCLWCPFAVFECTERVNGYSSGSFAVALWFHKLSFLIGMITVSCTSVFISLTNTHTHIHIQIHTVAPLFPTGMCLSECAIAVVMNLCIHQFVTHSSSHHLPPCTCVIHLHKHEPHMNPHIHIQTHIDTTITNASAFNLHAKNGTATNAFNETLVSRDQSLHHLCVLLNVTAVLLL